MLSITQYYADTQTWGWEMTWGLYKREDPSSSLHHAAHKKPGLSLLACNFITGRQKQIDTKARCPDLCRWVSLAYALLRSYGRVSKLTDMMLPHSVVVAQKVRDRFLLGGLGVILGDGHRHSSVHFFCLSWLRKKPL